MQLIETLFYTTSRTISLYSVPYGGAGYNTKSGILKLVIVNEYNNTGASIGFAVLLHLFDIQGM